MTNPHENFTGLCERCRYPGHCKKFNYCGHYGRSVVTTERETFCLVCEGSGCQECIPTVNNSSEVPQKKQHPWPFPEK